MPVYKITESFTELHEVRVTFEIEADTQEEALLQLKHNANALSDYKIVKETRKFNGKRINYHYFEDGEVLRNK
jgi:hypothetical protein